MAAPVNSEAATNDLDKIIEVEDEADINEAVAAIDEAVAASDATNSEAAVTSKDKRKRSEVWEHFHEVEVKDKKGNMVMMNKCIHCDRPYKVVMGGPTTTLQRHLQACPYFKRSKGKTQGLIKFESCESGTIPELNSSRSYDQMKCREIMAKMIIAHELPFAFVEYTWFNILMKYNNPFYQRVSRTTIRIDCIKVFETEKDKIKKNFKSVDRISLTSDCWTSNQTIGYMCLTAHYIDSDWKLQK
jgi:BED zinc finger